MNRLGLFGGTFDPIHVGHVEVALAARRKAHLSEILFVPDGNPPHKAGITPKHLRAEMVRLAIDGLDGCALCADEINRDGVTYTVDTLNAFKQSRPRDGLSYIVGADTLLVVLAWKNAPEVFRLTRLLVVMRPGEDAGAVTRYADQLKADFGAVVELLPVAGPDISSSEVRRRVHEGLSIDGLVAPKVADFIAQEGLYR